VPANPRVLASCRPVYEELDGWKEDIRNAKNMESLPGNTRRYIERIEEIIGVKMALVSVGPDRDETISLYDPFSGSFSILNYGAKILKIRNITR